VLYQSQTHVAEYNLQKMAKNSLRLVIYWKVWLESNWSRTRQWGCY